jgi:hypothetical protein
MQSQSPRRAPQETVSKRTGFVSYSTANCAQTLLCVSEPCPSMRHLHGAKRPDVLLLPERRDDDIAEDHPGRFLAAWGAARSPARMRSWAS